MPKFVSFFNKVIVLCHSSEGIRFLNAEEKSVSLGWMVVSVCI